MKTKLLQAFMALGVLGGAVTLMPTDAHAQASSNVGSLRGQIRDKANNEPAVGATVVATSPALQGEQVVLADDTGLYFLTSLPPGAYTLTVYYNDGTFTRGNVTVQIGKEAVVNITVDSTSTNGKPKGETIEIQGSAPVIDQGSTKTGVTLTEDYTRNVPTGRTFGAVVSGAAGAQSDTYGISVGGATSAENTYVVEGINTTDTAFGGISSNLPNEFVQETEVITGGYNAEYGRATGGIINVVTKTGSNEFHGSVFGNFSPGAFVSQAKTVSRDGGSIDRSNGLDYRYDLGAELGGPIIKDKLWFHVGFNPSVVHQTTTRLIQSQVDENQDGIADTDANGFAIHKLVSQSDIPATFNTYFFTAKINGAIDQNNQFQLSVFGNPRNATDVFGIVRNPSQTRWKYDDGAEDISGKYTSKLNEGKTQIDAVVGLHHGYETDKPFNSAENVPQTFYNYDRSLYDFADLEGSKIGACQDGAMGSSDPYPKIVNCPVTGYNEQGLGYLEQRTNDRYSAIASITQRVKLAGYHTFKVGGDVEVATYDATHSYTGGEIYRRNAPDDADATGSWQQRVYMKVARPLTDAEVKDPNFASTLSNTQVICANGYALCEQANSIHASTSNRSISGYAQDTWQLLPNFTLNLGIRYEQQVGYAASEFAGSLTPTGETVPDRAYTLNNLWAPRLGFIYDPTKEGKSKIFGHWGRFYENVPLDLNVRAFGGEIINFSSINGNGTTPGSTGYDPNCHVDHGSMGLVGALDACSDRSPSLGGEGVEFISPGMKGQYTQEIILGTEYEILPDFKVGVSYIHRTLPQVIEDISTDGGTNYLITNPGVDNSAQSRDLEAQSAAMLMKSGCSSFTDKSDGCNLQQRGLAEVLDNRSQQLKAVGGFDKPSRNYDALQFTVTQRPTARSLVLASYTYSVEKGNYPGLFSTETGQLDPNITSLYDLPDLMANRYGRLGLDRPHNVKVDGFYQFDLKQYGQLTTGGSFRAQSGLAHNALAASPHPGYGSGESYVLPRGAMPRSPMTSQLDVHLSYGHRVAKGTVLEAFVNVFNLFNQQDQLKQDENYTFDGVNPVVGGNLNDAAHAKTVDITGVGNEINKSALLNKNFTHTGTGSLTDPDLQVPRSVQLGLRLTF
jgi:outer membrane receptor protein involved in Fe transport